jgi:hypothetical protein
MARGEVVGEISIEVEADMRGFSEHVSAGVKAAGIKATKGDPFAPIVKEAEKAAREAGHGFGVEFDVEVKKYIGRHRQATGGGFFSGLLFGKRSVSSLTHDVEEVGAAVGEVGATLEQAATSGLGLGSAFTKLGSKAIGAIGPLIAKWAPLILLFSLLGVELIGIAGYLSQVVGLLGAIPTIGVVALAAIAPLVIAFQGIGTAVHAMATGDLEKIKQSMKGLTPSAQRFVRELNGVRPILRDIQRAVQEAFFKPLHGDVTKVLIALSPTLKRGLSGVAAILGQLGDRVFDFLAKPEVARGLDKIFAVTENILSAMSGPFGRFFSVFGRMIVAALPFAQKLLGIFGEWVDKFADKLAGWIASGKFEQWMETALVVGGQIKELVAQVFILLYNIFKLTGSDGQSAVQTLVDTLTIMNGLLTDPKIQYSLRGLLDLLNASLIVIGAMTVAFGATLLAVGALIGGVRDYYSWLYKAYDILHRDDPGKIKRSAEPLIQRRFAAGGITSGPSIAGESGPEAVIPLTNPARAAQVMSEAGLTGLMYGSGEGPEIHVYLGDREIQAVMRVEVRRGLNDMARSLRYQAREA